MHEKNLAVHMAAPAPPIGPWISSSSPKYSLNSMTLPLFEALEAEDLELASSQAQASLPPLPAFLISEANRGIWRRRSRSRHPRSRGIRRVSPSYEPNLGKNQALGTPKF